MLSTMGFLVLLSCAQLMPATAEDTTTSLTHTTLVIIVAIELFFAFGVATMCIVFSWNLLRSIRTANSNENYFQTMPQGDFPRVNTNNSSSPSVLSEPLTGTYNTFYRGRKNNPFSNPDLAGMEAGDGDSEAPAPAPSLFQSFFSYLRV